LITATESDLPVWIDALSGNTSDKTHFREVIKQYSKMLTETDEIAYFVMDSAMYTDKNIRQVSGDVKWITRVPETITMAKELIIETDEMYLVKSELKGYRIKSISKTYAGVDQKWVVIYSKEGYKAEIKTFNRNIEKENDKVEKKLWHFKNDEFKCEEDARDALKKMEGKWKYHIVDEYTLSEKKKTGKRGRPKKNSNDIKIIYQIDASFKKDNDAIETERKRKGKFILATNDLNLDQDVILKEYKGQQGVERGFRFIKDPMFFTDSTFLKKPQRIVSLVMIMGLSLLVYSIAQRKLRKALEKMDETVPNQLGKPTKKPTMRWIFQKFENITLLDINDEGKFSKQILNMKPIHEKILALMGEEYEKIYFLGGGCEK
jgi:transposase